MRGQLEKGPLKTLRYCDIHFLGAKISEAETSEEHNPVNTDSPKQGINFILLTESNLLLGYSLILIFAAAL